jgi:hypothetical protein
MDIEDSSVPYRAFLRSGPYPALSQRVLRSGGVLAQAAGWFALVVTAASAGYNLTQRLATPSAATSGESFVRPAVLPAFASSLGQPPSIPGLSGVENIVVPEGTANTERRAPVAVALADKALPARKRAGAIVQNVQPTAAEAAPEPTATVAPELTEPARAEQIAERVRALDTATQESAPAPAAPDPIESVLRDSIERQRVAASATKAPVVVAAKAARVTPPAPPSQPLVAAARVDAVNVRGPLSAAQLRRSVERVRPTLSDCYAAAARRAGQNRFAQLRVTVTIDEAGRVKAQPQVEGAQLPGFAECVGSAMSKLVCQAPDTGTAKAAIVLRFNPER